MATAPSSLIIFFLIPSVGVEILQRAEEGTDAGRTRTHTRTCQFLPPAARHHPARHTPRPTCVSMWSQDTRPSRPLGFDGPALPGRSLTGRSRSGGCQDHLPGDAPKCPQEGRRGVSCSHSVRLGMAPDARRLRPWGRPPKLLLSYSETPCLAEPNKQTPPWKTRQQVHARFHTAIPLSGTYPRTPKTGPNRTHIRLHGWSAHSTLKVERAQEPTNAGTDMPWSIHTAGHGSATKENEALTCATAWPQLENMTLRDGSHVQRSTRCGIPFL